MKKWNKKLLQVTGKLLSLYAKPVGGELWLVKSCVVEMENAFTVDRKDWTDGLSTLRISLAGRVLR